jgi:hypothetical protein
MSTSRRENPAQNQTAGRRLGRGAYEAAAGNDPRFERGVEVGNGTSIAGERRRLNFIAGSNVTLTVADAPATESVDVTINSTGGGAGIPDGTYNDIIVSGGGTALTLVSPVVTSRLGTGTADSSTYLRGDQTYAHVESVRFSVKNTSGSTINAGTPVYATGSVGASGAVTVSPANASVSASMPAIGLLESTLANNAEGFAVSLGVIRHVDTSAYTVNQVVYVAAGGGLTGTRPTGASTGVQNIGRVVRVDASTGEIAVMGPGRTNDVPNQIGYAYLPVGSGANTVCAGDDGRLSDRRSAVAIYETGGGLDLLMGAVADGEYLQRVGSSIVGGTPSGGPSGSVDLNVLRASVALRV